MIVPVTPDGGDEIGGVWVPCFRISRDEVLRDRVHLVEGALLKRKDNSPVPLQLDRDGYHKFTLMVGSKALYFAAHRAIWFLHYGEWPKDTLDHINFDRTDNRIENLRDMPRSENVGRQRPRAPLAENSGAGITKRKGCRSSWSAQIDFGGTRYWLGTFRSEDAALAARLAAEQAIADGKRPLTISNGRSRTQAPKGCARTSHRKAS